MKKVKKKNILSVYIYGIYVKLLNTEKHYAVLQAKFKTSAAYWLLVVFAALGLIFSAQETELPLDRLFITLLICVIGLIGNQLFWYEDMIVQERFLSMNIYEAVRMENNYKWLPKVHEHKYFSHKMVIRFKNIFYVGSNAILFAIISFVLFFLFKDKFVMSLAISFVAFSLFIFFLRYMFVRSYKNELSVLKELIND